MGSTRDNIRAGSAEIGFDSIVIGWASAAECRHSVLIIAHRIVLDGRSRIARRPTHSIAVETKSGRTDALGSSDGYAVFCSGWSVYVIAIYYAVLIQIFGIITDRKRDNKILVVPYKLIDLAGIGCIFAPCRTAPTGTTSSCTGIPSRRTWASPGTASTASLRR